jgi:hypothetical protein
MKTTQNYPLGSVAEKMPDRPQLRRPIRYIGHGSPRTLSGGRDTAPRADAARTTHRCTTAVLPPLPSGNKKGT